MSIFVNIQGGLDPAPLYPHSKNEIDKLTFISNSRGVRLRNVIL